MKVKSIFVNLPIKDLKKTREFCSKFGFSFNKLFLEDKTLCLVLNDELVYSMLITHEMFSTFKNSPIADGTTTQVVTAIKVDSREQVKLTHKTEQHHTEKVPTTAGCIAIALPTFTDTILGSNLQQLNTNAKKKI